MSQSKLKVISGYYSVEDADKKNNRFGRTKDHHQKKMEKVMAKMPRIRKVLEIETVSKRTGDVSYLYYFYGENNEQ